MSDWKPIDELFGAPDGYIICQSEKGIVALGAKQGPNLTVPSIPGDTRFARYYHVPFPPKMEEELEPETKDTTKE